MLKTISKDLRFYAWRFQEGSTLIEAMLQFSLGAYRESQRAGGQDTTSKDADKHADVVEREFIFSLAHKLGTSSLSIFSDCWRNFLSCQELQQLITVVAPLEDSKDDETKSAELAPELVKIIEEFYESRLFHEEDSCLLLEKYFKPGDVLYGRIVTMILENAEHYHPGALFQLARLQTASRPGHKAVMNADIFAIITKAFENLKGSTSPKILECVDWVFSMCMSNRRDPRRDPARTSYYTKMVSLVCKHARSQREILLRVLKQIESQPSLMKHSTAAELGLALVAGYREHFVARLRECGHGSYAAVIAEMQRARLECRHYVKDGEMVFGTEVLDVIRTSFHTKKKLINLLSVDFPITQKSASC